MSKPHLHQSQMAMLSRCGEAFRRRYIEGEKIPPAVAMITGSATHKTVEDNLHHKIENDGELLPIDHIRDLARDTLLEKWDEGISLDEDELEKGEKKVKGEAVDHAIALSELHATELAPMLSPKVDPEGEDHGIEWPWVMECDGYPYDLAGRIDLIEEFDLPGKPVPRLRVRDLKTKARSPSQADVDSSMQLTLYSLATKVHLERDPQEVILDALVKTKTPKVISLSSTRDDDDYRMFMRRFERSVEIIDKGIFTPASQEDWFCSRRFCGYFDTCPFAKGAKSFGYEKKET